MKTLTFAMFTALAACGGSSASAPAPDPGPGPTDEAAEAPPSFCTGKRAELRQWMGMGSDTIELTCKDGAAVLVATLDEARGDSESDTRALDRAQWDTVWAALDGLGWRTLPAECPELKTPQTETPGISGLDLEVTDGATTMKISCAPQNLDPKLVELIGVFEAASESTAKK